MHVTYSLEIMKEGNCMGDPVVDEDNIKMGQTHRAGGGLNKFVIAFFWRTLVNAVMNLRVQ
jgi:hypothetical protein